MALLMKAVRCFETSESTLSETQRVAEDGGHDKPCRTKITSFLFCLRFLFYSSYFSLPVFIYLQSLTVFTVLILLLSIFISILFHSFF